MNGLFHKYFSVEIAFFKKMGFTPCKAEQPLRGMRLQEAEKDYSIQNICLKRTYSQKMCVNSRLKAI